MRAMPLLWWLRPVSRHARVGEHSAVVWKFAVAMPRTGEAVEARRGDVGPVAAELRVAHVVEQHDHDVGGALGRRGHGRPPPLGLVVGAPDDAFELGRGMLMARLWHYVPAARCSTRS